MADEKKNGKIVLANGCLIKVEYCRAVGDATSSLLRTIDNRKCVFCQQPTTRYTIARLDGGEWNGVPVCDTCHRSTSHLPAREGVLVGPST